MPWAVAMLVVALIGAGNLAAVPLADMGCSSYGAWDGSCYANNNGGQLDVGGTQRGNEGGSESREPDTPTDPGSSDNSWGGPPANTDTDTCDLGDMCRDSYSVELIPRPTLSDLASFRPNAPTVRGEPAGIGLAGMATNFIARAESQVLTGTLFDRPVSVQFVPAGYEFDYGDGSSRSSDSGGNAWQQLGNDQFTPTSTSHAFRQPGNYEVTVTVLYSASVSFFEGIWLPVDGYVRASTSYPVRVLEVHTALVGRTCLENPAGVGC